MNNRNSQSVSKQVAGKSQPWDIEQAMAIISEYASRDYTNSKHTSSKQANGKHASHVSGLIPALQALQHCFGYIDDKTLPSLAQSFNLSRAEVYGVISFYHDFRKAPPGNCVIKICQAESCQAMGSKQLSEHARSVLGIDFHETTDNGTYTLEPVYCLGNCACSPAIMIDGRVYGRVDSSRFDALLNVSGDLNDLRDKET